MVGNWLTELPEEEGDYLWLNMWGCDCCCVRSSGICWIREVRPEELEEEHKPHFHWTGKDGKYWGLFWEGSREINQYTIRPDGKPDVDYFLKLDLPPARD